MTDAEKEAALLKLTADVKAALETILRRNTGSPVVSRWNGIVRLEGDSGAVGRYGAKDWSCAIRYARDTWDDVKTRYQVAIHESVHGFSEGLTPQAYVVYVHLEEGVVEQVWRMVREELLTALGENPKDYNFRREDRDSPYNIYVEQLEAERKRTGKQKKTFYFTLLRTPLDQREDLIDQWIQENRRRKMKRTH